MWLGLYSGYQAKLAKESFRCQKGFGMVCRRLRVLGPVMLSCAFAGCDDPPSESQSQPVGSQTPAARPESESSVKSPTSPWLDIPTHKRDAFVDITARVGLDFTHQSGHTDRHVLPEIMGGGAAIFDYDNDGDLDLYLINSGDHLPISGTPITASNRLYRQEADGSFADVTDESGLAHRGYGMGCAVGDIDNDGDLDVYITNWGPDALYQNNGDGTFSQITAAAGIDNARWSTSAAFLDYDRDGLLDLYVANYVLFDPDRDCTDDTGRTDYCGPKPFPGEPDVLYHNEGDARFTDESIAVGITSAAYAGLGVVCADIDDDGWIDIYTANDGDPNNLWINQRDGSFIDDAILLGVAFNRHGQAEAGMGVTASDADNDGDLDLFVTHLLAETNTYYRNLGRQGFDDATASARLGPVSANLTGFGTAFFDFDNDGSLDLAVANGAVARRPNVLADNPPFWNDFVEPNLLFHNDGSGVFQSVTDRAGSFIDELEISRGLIPADLDRDGDLDLLVTNIEGPARVYRNDLAGDNNWIQIRTMLGQHHREAIGARVTIVTTDQQFVRHAIPPGGYLTSGHATIHLGLGATQRVLRFEVRWPDGQREVFPGCAARRTIELTQGEGDAIDDATANDQ